MPWRLREEASTTVHPRSMQSLKERATALLMVWSLLMAVPSISLNRALIAAI